MDITERDFLIELEEQEKLLQNDIDAMFHLDDVLEVYYHYYVAQVRIEKIKSIAVDMFLFNAKIKEI